MKTTTYSTKSGYEVSDMDLSNRRVKMYLAKFDNMDSDGDVIRRGAFAKSISERGFNSTSNRKIAFLRHHEWTMPIGKFVELTEDANGLLAVAELGRSTMGEDAFRDYQDGIILEHSIGFQYIKDKMSFIEDDSLPNKGYYEIRELMLYEGSAVTFGANSMTNVVSVSKAQNKEARTTFMDESNKMFSLTLKSLLERMETSEETFEYEMKLKYLYSQIAILANAESEFHSIKNEPLTKEGLDWFNVINSINFTN